MFVPDWSAPRSESFTRMCAPTLAIGMALTLATAISLTSSAQAAVPDQQDNQPEQPRQAHQSPALGISPTFGRWVDTVHLRYNPENANNLWTDSGLMIELLREAADRWERVSGIRFDIALAGTTTPQTGEIPVSWRYEPSGNWAGRAGPHYASYDTDRGYFPYSAGSVVLNSAVNLNQDLDMLQVLTHELGHILGLGHSENPQSIMYANPYNRLQFPVEDDIRAVQVLYGQPSIPFALQWGPPEWQYVPPPAASAEKTRYLFKPNQHSQMVTGHRVALDTFANVLTSSINDATPDNQWVVLSGAIGNFNYNAATDIPALLTVISPTGQLYASRRFHLLCGARQACINSMFIDRTETMKMLPGTWRVYVTEDEKLVANPQLLFSTTVEVDTFTEYNRTPQARVEMEAGPEANSLFVQVFVDDPEGNSVDVIWHLPGTRIDRNGDGMVDNHLRENLGSNTQTARRHITFPNGGEHDLFIQVNDDAGRRGSDGEYAFPGSGFQTLLKVSVTFPLTSLANTSVMSSHVPVRNSRWLANINGVKPDSDYQLPYQLIGSVADGAERLYSCVLVFTQGQPDPAYGGELDVTFEITSLERGEVSLIANRHSQRVPGANPSHTRCSGRFETSTGIYRDTLRLDDTVFDVTFRLTDDTDLKFGLIAAEELLRED